MVWRKDGWTSEKLWLHQLGPYPIWPSVADIDGDGLDDVLFVCWDMCVGLRGLDGGFVHPPETAATIWKQELPRDGQHTIYGPQLPLDIDANGELDILLAGTWGQIGAWDRDRQRLKRRQHPHHFLRLAAVRQHHHDVILMDASQIPVNRFGGVQEMTACTGRSKRGRDLLPHQTGLPHATDNDTSSTLEQAVNRSTE